MATLGQAYDANPTQALKQAFACGWILASELRDIGVDFSFAPVLDTNHGRSSVIGGRAFHSNADVIVVLASALIDGIHASGMKCVGKHFPGHGYAVADSHQELPIDKRSMAAINSDLSVFSRLIDKLDAMMPAHVLYPQVDEKPAGFSRQWIQVILRQRLGFQGAVFSDDLSMQAACFIQPIEARVQAALTAGCDMVLICNHPELLAKVIDLDIANNSPLAIQAMRADSEYKLDKITHAKHLQTLQPLL